MVRTRERADVASAAEAARRACCDREYLLGHLIGGPGRAGEQIEQFVGGRVESGQLPGRVDDDDAGRRGVTGWRGHGIDEQGAAHAVGDVRVDVQQECHVVVVEAGLPEVAVQTQVAPALAVGHERCPQLVADPAQMIRGRNLILEPCAPWMKSYERVSPTAVRKLH